MGVAAHIFYQFLLEIIALMMLNGLQGTYKQDHNIYTECVTNPYEFEFMKIYVSTYCYIYISTITLMP